MAFFVKAFALLQLVAAVQSLHIPVNVRGIEDDLHLNKRQSTITCRITYPTSASSTCQTVLTDYGITLATFYSLNPQVGPDCAGFLPGSSYCIRGTVTTSSVSSTTSSVPTDTTTDGQCGANKGGLKCTTAFGMCCSEAGWCGTTSAHCGTGCQSAFGTCDPTTTTTSTVAPPTPSGISTDGTCGGANGFKCTGSVYGDCCSISGYCGRTAAYCGQGCNPTFGTCLTTNIPSNTGECGANNGGYTCYGGPFNGYCCGPNGYCGVSPAYCGSGCQSAYGRCTMG